MEKNQENSVFKVTRTRTALKIEIALKDLEFLFVESPNNGYGDEPIKVKRGKRAEFADFVIRYITEAEDPDTGEPPLLKMFEEAFITISEGDEAFCKYPNE